MEWNKLLQRHPENESRTEQDAAASRDGESLIRQVCGQIGMTGSEDASAERVAAEERVCLPDGYMRRSPIQRYRTPRDFAKKRFLRAALVLLALCLAALLALALLKSGLFRLK